jgi:hypothetical protein
MQGPRTETTAWAAIQGIEAVYMIRKGQVLGITRHNLQGQAWACEPCSTPKKQVAVSSAMRCAPRSSSCNTAL